MAKYSYFDFIPMIVSSIYGARAGGGFEAWKIAFLIGIGLAVVQFIVYRVLKRSIDPLALGLNLFLLVGAIGFNLMIPFILSLLDQMRESASFIFVAIVGTLFVLLKEEGLLEHSGPGTKMYSSLLVLLVLMSGAVSFYFKGDQLFSITLPFMMLFFARSYFNKKVLAQGSSN